nr:hypothetical protein [uncultured Campylobacter sp.]
MRILLKFDSIDYMPYLHQILTSKPQKSSRDASPYCFMLKFKNSASNFIHRDPHHENVNLNTQRVNAR